jgi:hypothetical protein
MKLNFARGSALWQSVYYSKANNEARKRWIIKAQEAKL